MPVHVSVEGTAKGAEVIGALVRRYAVRMLRALTLEAAELSLLVCDDKIMRRLNRDHRHIDRPTDVLAFAMREGKPIAGIDDCLGDIVISWPTAQRQAREHAWTPEREVCLLLAHGVLHLLGFDHVTRVEERRMMARTHLLMAAGLQTRRRVDKPRAAMRGSSGRNLSDTRTHREKAKDPDRLQSR
jgi:probable rRNA maturation factor